MIKRIHSIENYKPIEYKALSLENQSLQKSLSDAKVQNKLLKENEKEMVKITLEDNIWAADTLKSLNGWEAWISEKDILSNPEALKTVILSLTSSTRN